MQKRSKQTNNKHSKHSKQKTSQQETIKLSTYSKRSHHSKQAQPDSKKDCWLGGWWPPSSINGLKGAYSEVNWIWLFAMRCLVLPPCAMHHAWCEMHDASSMTSPYELIHSCGPQSSNQHMPALTATSQSSLNVRRQRNVGITSAVSCTNSTMHNNTSIPTRITK